MDTTYCPHCGAHWDDHYWSSWEELLLCPMSVSKDKEHGYTIPEPVETWSEEDEEFYRIHCDYMKEDI